MKYYSKKQWTQKLTVMVFLAMALGGTAVQAMPSGADIRSGQGSISQDGKNMTVQQNSQRMAIDWTKFDIAKDETVRYAQPDRNAISLNRVTGGQQSVIAGNLNANGNVVLVNPNGVVFTKNSSVDVGGLVASTARLNDEAMKNFGNGKDSLGLSLDKDSTASVINEGQIKAQGGLVALHAANVENKGTITNEGGTLAMAAAKNLTLSAADDDKLNFTVDGELAKSQALNSGSLKADGGYVVMTAKSAGDVLSTVVNNTGTIEAKTLRKNEKGQIFLDGGDNGQVEVSGTLDASGTEEGQSAGNIKVIGEKTIVHDGTNLLAKGSMDGGKIETSGDVLNLGDNLNIDAKGVNGKAGEWLLDPLDVIIADKDPTTSSNYDNATKKTAVDSDFTKGSASIGYNDPAATDANASSVNSAVTWISTDMVEKRLNAGTNVTIQAAATNGSANIIVKNDINKKDGVDATLTLDAMRNITINGNISSTSNKLNVVLNADSNGDKIGAVIINGNINTNGGDFTSASGGNVNYASDSANTKGYDKGTLSGQADPEGHTVGTYFGHVDTSGTADGVKDDRLIKTSGGKITLNGEIAIGLNGGTLTLDSSNSNGEKGDITVTGIINSGNSYGAYVYGTTTWDELTADKVNDYLTSDTVPAYHYQGVNYVKNPDGSYKTTTDAADFSNGEPHYTFDKETDTQNIRWLGDGSSTAVSITKGKGYSSVIITEGKMSTKEYLQYVAVSDPAGFLSRYMTSNPTITVGSTSYALKVDSVTVNGVSNNALGYKVGNKFTALTQQQIQSLADGAFTLAKNSTNTTAMSNGSTAHTNLTNDIKRLIASNWFVSETLAKYDPKTKTYNNGKSAVGDSYLATITTILENSLTTPNGQQILWAGGRGSGVLNKTGSNSSANDKLYPYSFYGMPDDPTYQDGMYWVTGPEGEANDGKGTQFYSNAGSNWKNGIYGKTVYGYANWDTYKDGGKTRQQPDNSAPFLTVGYGTTGKWDDAAMGGGTTVGFVKETNLANSSLNIKAGGGTVSLEGDLGKAKALDTVNIESTGTVTLGNPNNTATTYHNGTVYADHGVYISGGTVTVGGEIHSGTTDKTASASDITSRTDGYQNTAFQLDNVTIKSAGDLTVHGVESDGYTGSDSNLKGGKISLTSTGKTGKITLGAGVDYNGKATEGTLTAASAEQGAVVIDAQGSQGSLVNSTTGTKAITTGEGGTWQVYSASPDNNTFGTNLNSGTDAQWTSKSASNNIATENKYGKTPNVYSDTSSNKFIFQATPVITLYADDYLKTYGDEVSADTLKKLLHGKEVFTGLDGQKHNMTDYSSAFQEKDYTEYVSGEDTVTVTSVGSNATATRIGGKYEATEKSGADGKNAVYDLTVNLNDAKALDGYAIDTENGKLEIKKRTASITGTGNQTYGDTDGTIKNWTDIQTNIADGSTVSYTTSIKSDSDYTKNRDGRNTADHGTYNDSVSFDGLKITDSNGNEVDIADNYDLTTTGTIDVAKAKLTVNTEGKTATYGTVDEDYKSSLDKTTQALNGDKEADLLKELGLTYTLDPNDSAYIDSDGDGKYDKTNHVKYKSDGTYDSYTLDVANTKELKNYDVTIKDSTVTLERAQATVDTDKVTTDYGTVNTSYTSHFNTAVNGDNGDELLKQLDLSYSTDAYKDADHTNNVKDGGYDLEVQANGSLTYNDYDVTVNNSNVTLNKVNLTVNPEDIHRIYGQAQEVQEDAKTAYNLSGFANGDTKDTVDATNKDGKTIDQLVKVTNDVSKALKDDGTHTQNASADGYDMVTTATGDLTNYNIVIGNPKKVYLDKAKLTVSVNDTSTTYGSDKWTPYTYTLSGNTNGDSEDDVRNKQIKVSYSNGGVKSDASNDAVKTQAAGEYALTGKFTLSGDTATNYEIDRDKSKLTGKATVNKADLTLTLKDVSTTYGQGFDNSTYGYKKDAADLQGLTNGDAATAITDVLQDSDFTYENGGAKSDPGNQAVKTQNAGSYQITGSTSKTLDNYNIKVVNPGTSTVEKAKLILKVGDTSTTYGSSDWTPYTYTLSGNANGDSEEDVRNNQIEVSYSNGGEKSDPNNSAVKTQNAGDYGLTGTFTLKGDTAKNYEIDEVNSDLTGKATVNKATVKVKLNDVSTTYGTAFDTSKYGYDTSSIEGLTNGDGSGVMTSALDGTYGTGNITYTNTGDASAEEKQAGKVTKTVNGGPYYLEGSTNQTLDNYNIEIENGNATINKATLHLSTGDYTEVYGNAKAVQNDLDKATTVSGEKNGDSLAELTKKIGITNTTDALLSADRTNDVKYKTDGSLDSYGITTDFKKSLDNYNVEQDKTGSVTLKPKEITIKNTMTQQYGSSDRTYKEATVPEGQLANGDKISTKDLKFDIKADGEYAKSLAENKKNNSEAITADAKTYTGELIHTGGGITHENGTDAYKNYKVTVEGDIVVTPAPLTITTKDVTTEYGTVKETTSTATGLVNGDQNYASDISYDYGDYGHGYLDNNTRTNNVGSYGITTKATNTMSDFLKNYTISYGDATLTITPKDVYFHVDGKGSTFDDIIYTVTDPNHPGNSDAINSQLPYGETVTGGYGIGQALPDMPGSKDHYYTVDSTINGTPVYDNNGRGTQVGNYVYHPTGQAVIHFDQPQKPDQTTHYVEGARRPQDKIEAALPVFRVDASGVVKQYGTYGIESQSQAVTLSPTGMRMPEPNQTSTQDRKYLTTLKTDHGHGTFRLEYNGVVLRVIPVDPAAEQIVEAGDKLKNVALSEQALHAAYTQMGLDLVNLKGVYIYMAPM